MMYQLLFRDRAVDEMQDAYNWYEEQVTGLGDKFIAVVKNNIDIILRNPKSFKTSYKNFKEVFIRKFPFIIVYYIDDSKRAVVIMSVFHSSRNPKRKYKN